MRSLLAAVAFPPSSVTPWRCPDLAGRCCESHLKRLFLHVGASLGTLISSGLTPRPSWVRVQKRRSASEPLQDATSRRSRRGGGHRTKATRCQKRTCVATRGLTSAPRWACKKLAQPALEKRNSCVRPCKAARNKRVRIKFRVIENLSSQNMGMRYEWNVLRDYNLRL